MEILNRNWEKMGTEAHNPATQLKKTTIYQDNSLFTLVAIFKDGNKFRAHSWRQEIRGKNRKVDHRNAWQRLYNLATTCTCNKNPVNKCFWCNHTTILIYCNITDQLVFKSNYKNIKVTSDLGFYTNDKTGSNFLISLNGQNVQSKSFEHSKRNFNFVAGFG